MRAGRREAPEPGLEVEVLEEAEAPQLVDLAVHARDVERERVRARLERGLVAGANVGDEVLERGLDRVELALPAALLRRHLARGDLALDYAASDTRYLPQLRDILRDRLEERARLGWAREEFALLERTAWSGEPPDEPGWEGVRDRLRRAATP